MRISHDLVTAGSCKSCGQPVPLLQKNKVPGRDAWACLKCKEVNELGDLGQVKLHDRIRLNAKLGGGLL